MPSAQNKIVLLHPALPVEQQNNDCGCCTQARTVFISFFSWVDEWKSNRPDRKSMKVKEGKEGIEERTTGTIIRVTFTSEGYALSIPTLFNLSIKDGRESARDTEGKMMKKRACN